MRKFILIVALFLLNIILYKYLERLVINKQSFDVFYDTYPLVINKKNISFYDKSDFIFDDYFLVLGCEKYTYDYFFEDMNINLSVKTDDNTINLQYHYSFLEKEVVTEVVYKEIYKPIVSYTTDTNQNNSYTNIEQNVQNSPDIHHIEDTHNSFTLLNNSLSYSINTELGTIISGISGSFISDSYVSVDYCMLNPSVPGEYPVYLYTQDGCTYIVLVIIE